MYIISSLFTNNLRIPIILNEFKAPFLLPFLFTITNLKNKSERTKNQYIVIIRDLYHFFLNQNIDIEGIIIEGKFNLIIHKIEIFFYSNPRFKDPYNLQIIKIFLVWCSNKYSRDSKEANVIVNKIGLFIPNYSKSLNNEYRSLILPDIKLIRSVIDIKSPSNPFSPKVKLRNWIMIEILLQSGLRLGELLKLKLNDFIRIEDKFYIKISNHKIDDEDKRKIKPSNKNIYSFRTISITPELYEVIHYYTIKQRRNGNKIRHSYLFVGTTGNPLTIRAAQVPFRTINETLLKNKESLSTKFSPHVLRHTFADNFLKFLIENLNIDMERAKDELRTICGWSLTSSMPLRYASRFIRAKANEHNMNRINNSYHKI